MISIGGLYFLIFGPGIGLVLGIIVAAINSSKKGSGSYTRSSNFNNSSSFELEMKAHNARVEQMMMEQHRTMIENESRRISESINKPLSEQFDTRLTNIFRNPWDGIL